MQSRIPNQSQYNDVKKSPPTQYIVHSEASEPNYKERYKEVLDSYKERFDNPILGSRINLRGDGTLITSGTRYGNPIHIKSLKIIP